MNSDEDALNHITSQQSKIDPIVLPVISKNLGPEVVLFNVDDIKRLRDQHGILGVLIGTLAQYPQQNVFLSVPLRLMFWEVVWLIETKCAILVDYNNYRNNLPKSQVSNLITVSKSTKTDEDRTKTEANRANFIVTHNEALAHDTDLQSLYQVSLLSYIKAHIQNYLLSPEKLLANYQYYKYLKNKQFFINPGLKFGGDLVIYPGDPLKYHSYSIVKFSVFNLNDLIVGGRLASAVKKTILLLDTVHKPKVEQVDEEFVSLLFEDEAMMAFSIEWAGFG